MDRLAKSIVYMLLGAFILGIVVILANPLYRQTAVEFWRGSTTNTPIWHANEDYYPEIVPEQ
jgi:hypothetical protein